MENQEERLQEQPSLRNKTPLETFTVICDTTLMEIAVDLPNRLNKKLDALAEETGKPKSHFLKRAVEFFLDEMEDLALANKRLSNPKKRYSAKEAEQLLDVED